MRKNLIGDSHEKISAGNCFERSEFQLDGIAAEDNSGRKKFRLLKLSHGKCCASGAPISVRYEATVVSGGVDDR
jgi:hypothetical protein